MWWVTKLPNERREQNCPIRTNLIWGFRKGTIISQAINRGYLSVTLVEKAVILTLSAERTPLTRHCSAATVIYEVFAALEGSCWSTSLFLCQSCWEQRSVGLRATCYHHRCSSRIYHSPIRLHYTHLYFSTFLRTFIDALHPFVPTLTLN